MYLHAVGFINTCKLVRVLVSTRWRYRRTDEVVLRLLNGFTRQSLDLFGGCYDATDIMHSFCFNSSHGSSVVLTRHGGRSTRISLASFVSCGDVIESNDSPVAFRHPCGILSMRALSTKYIWGVTFTASDEDQLLNASVSTRQLNTSFSR
mmetsp:Transcript_20749/g.30913  ORF Transcript_20749/g.30913 Transcript_20749/m.30913 type:complete len:150 (+) Transcript_20749:378-827(+)